jgi:glycosyltransferase involved in cell wall biosynthesis
MRIAVVEPRGRGGMIHYAYRLCAAMAQKGADVTLITSSDYELADRRHDFAVQPILRPTSRPSGPASATAGPLARRLRRARRLASGATVVVGEWLRLVRHLRRMRPDVVQFGSIEHAIEAPFLWYLRARGMTLTDVVHEPEIRSASGLRWAVDVRLYRGVYRCFDALFLHGEANRRRFAELYPRVPPGRVHAIQMGSLVILDPDEERDVDLRARHGFPPEAPVVVFFGTLLPSKGIEDLLEAFVTVRATRPDARLLIAGNPSRLMEDGELEGVADRLGIGDVVTVDAGYVPNEELGALMGLARVVVLPYRSATASGALQVAYAYGRPVIATRVGGLPEVVEEGESGLVVAPESPDELAEAILALVDDPGAAERMGAHALELSRTRFAWATAAGTILAVCRGIISR